MNTTVLDMLAKRRTIYRAETWAIIGDLCGMTLREAQEHWEAHGTRLYELLRIIFQHTPIRLLEMSRRLGIDYGALILYRRAFGVLRTAHYTPTFHARLCVALIRCEAFKGAYKSVQCEIVEQLIETLELILQVKGDDIGEKLDTLGSRDTAHRLVKELLEDCGHGELMGQLYHTEEVQAMESRCVGQLSDGSTVRQDTDIERPSAPDAVEEFIMALRREIDEEPLLKNKYKKAFNRIITHVAQRGK